MGLGKTNRIGGTSVERETSSIMRPLCRTRRRTVPVAVVFRMEENVACSAGGSDARGACGSGISWRTVCSGIETTGSEDSEDSWVEIRKPTSIEQVVDAVNVQTGVGLVRRDRVKW